MTMTQADWAALAAAGAAGGTNYLEALNAQRQAALSGVPGGAGGAGVGNLPGSSSATAVGADAILQVENQFPDLAWMLNVPDLAGVIVGMAQQGVTDTAKVTAALEATGWWQTHSQSVRQWIQEVETDPAQAQADMAAKKSDLNATLSQMGLHPSGQQLDLLASQALAMGWTTQETKDNIAQNITSNPDGSFNFNYAGVTTKATGGSLGYSVDQVQAEAAKYLVPISGSTAQSFATALAQGTMDMQGVDAYMQQQAQSLYPSIAGAIKNGVTPADYVTPYKEVAAQLLGVSPNAINMMDPKWQRPLSTPGPDGKPVAMSLYDWQQTLMKDPQYGYTNSVNAKDRASSMAAGLAEMFGRAPSGPSGSTAFSAAGAPRMPGVPIT